jgi:hypothetical protein
MTIGRVAIVGGGISGLATAPGLIAAGVEVALFEARPTVGGRLRSLTIDDRALDLGATWFWPDEQRVASLMRTLALPVHDQWRAVSPLRVEVCDWRVEEFTSPPDVHEHVNYQLFGSASLRQPMWDGRLFWELHRDFSGVSWPHRGGAGGSAAYGRLPNEGAHLMLPTIEDLLVEYQRALDYTDTLWLDLSEDEVHWRADEDASGAGWHLAHQPAVAHFMMRNLTAAEPPVDPVLERLADSATPVRDRGELPSIDQINEFRTAVAERVNTTATKIASGDVGAPQQLAVIGSTMLTAIINHEYQHSTWIAELRTEQFGRTLPDLPSSELLSLIEGYPIIALGNT